MNHARGFGNVYMDEQHATVLDNVDIGGAVQWLMPVSQFAVNIVHRSVALKAHIVVV